MILLLLTFLAGVCVGFVIAGTMIIHDLRKLKKTILGK
jgi:hypothetical protein